MPSIGPKRFLLDVDDDNEFRFQSFMIHGFIHHWTQRNARVSVSLSASVNSNFTFFTVNKPQRVLLVLRYALWLLSTKGSTLQA